MRSRGGSRGGGGGGGRGGGTRGTFPPPPLPDGSLNIHECILRTASDYITSRNSAAVSYSADTCTDRGGSRGHQGHVPHLPDDSLNIYECILRTACDL